MNIVLNIDLKETFSKLDSYIIIHNKTVKSTKKGEPVPSSMLSTAKKMLQMLFKHLQNAERRNEAPGVFKCNNKALATSMQYNRATAFRHITRLIKAGVITHKVFHGTNSNYEIHFNPEILRAQITPEYCNSILMSALKKNKHLSLHQQQEIKQIRPSFADFPTYFIPLGNIAESNLICNKYFLQEQNNNITVSTVDNYLLDSAFLQEHGTPESDQQPQIEAKTPLTASVDEDFTPGGGAVQNPVNNAFVSTKSLNRYVATLYQIAINLLWERKMYDEEEHETAQRYIEYFLTGGKKEVPLGVILHRKSNFLKRIILVKKFIDRSPDRYVQNPALYFNPNYAHGFAGTKNWLEKVNIQQKNSEEYHSHMNILQRAWNDCANYPGIATYQKHREKISRMRDTKLLNLFNKGVISPELISHEGMKRIRNDHYSLVN